MSKLIIQKHHLIYENKKHGQKEIVGKVFKGEHWILSNLNRRKNTSEVFIRSLKLWIVLNEDNAKKLK